MVALSRSAATTCIMCPPPSTSVLTDFFLTKWCNLHDDVIKWKHFPRYWPFVRGIHRSPVNSPHKGKWRGALMFSLICVWINDWVNNREAGDLRRYRAYYGVTVMDWKSFFFLQNFFRQIQAQTVKICMALFSSYGNKGLIYTMIAAHRVYLFTEAILLQAKLCNVYRVYCLNYILNELEAKLKNIKFVSKILQWNQFSHRRICIMKYIQIHCQLSKFTTQDIPL